jgi:ubiquinone/menaquinone biosynthesis C-methylase UbiE
MNDARPIPAIQGMDIYLIDQIMKGRYLEGDTLLDAGTGSGRNMNWFIQNNFHIVACDANPDMSDAIKERYGQLTPTFIACNISALPFANGQFDHILANAVLHFAKDESEFNDMLKELVRVTKTGGSLFIRTCSDIGLEGRTEPLGDGRHTLPDGTERFLVNREGIERLLQQHALELLEPVKSVNVSDLRVMTTLVLSKRTGNSA